MGVIIGSRGSARQAGRGSVPSSRLADRSLLPGAVAGSFVCDDPLRSNAAEDRQEDAATESRRHIGLETLCVLLGGLSIVAFSGPHDIVMLYRILEGGAAGNRTLGGEILNRLVLAAAVFPGLWLSWKATSRGFGRLAPEQAGRLARFDALTFLPLLLLVAPIFPIWGARGLDGLLPAMLLLFLGAAGSVLAAKAALASVVALRRDARKGFASRSALLLAAGIAWGAVVAWRTGPVAYMLPPWDPAYSESFWPEGWYVLAHVTLVSYFAFLLFSGLWAAALASERGERSVAAVAGAGVVVIAGALVAGSLVAAARDQARYDDAVFARSTVQEDHARAEIGGRSEWALVVGAPASLVLGDSKDDGSRFSAGEICRSARAGCRPVNLGFEAGDKEATTLRVSVAVMREGWLWYRRGTGTRFVLKREGETGEPLARIELDPRNRPADRKWASVTFERRPGERCVLETTPLGGSAGSAFAVAVVRPEG